MLGDDGTEGPVAVVGVCSGVLEVEPVFRCTRAEALLTPLPVAMDGFPII